MSEQAHFLRKEKEAVIIQRKKTQSGAGAAMEPLQLGKRVKAIRLGKSLTLEEASQLTGLARSTLSKIENEQISPTFAAVTKLVNGLGIDIPQLFSPAGRKGATGGRRDITLKGTGTLHPTPTYEHELLATELSGKKMIPYKTTICARSFEEYQDWIRHEGEEFMLVLSGKVRLYTEFYQPADMEEGDSAYYDASMGHVVISTGKEDARILWVTT
ncbi:helix-turn-helix domain-containing protein [Sansalvadorimonas verongulae]|uniref:helix-turn-helix domain-containing protein n=1 Tax=Sansalvadorimonas verongulae TaxID=2172824 RepID=UPI0012BB67B7|nr:XRE family transcriptional regulator [Sansalvadorimonas verongulae]MTI12380.1 XRE family transcriptional regulator [Sansalvadorimonas verongulae]